MVFLCFLLVKGGGEVVVFICETVVSQTAKTALTDHWSSPLTPKNGEISKIKRVFLFDVRPYIYCFYPAEGHL